MASSKLADKAVQTPWNLRALAVSTNKLSFPRHLINFARRSIHTTRATMTVTPLNNLQEFRDAIASEKGAVVDFHAEWCGPCKLISPKFEGFAEKYTNLSYYSVDVDAAADVAEEVGIQAMPTFIAFRKGDKVGSLKGAIPAALETLVKEQDAIAAGAA